MQKFLLSLIAILSLIIGLNLIENTFDKSIDRKIIINISDNLPSQTKKYLNCLDNYIKTNSNEDLDKAKKEQAKLNAIMITIETYPSTQSNIHDKVISLQKQNNKLKEDLLELLNSSNDSQKYSNLKKTIIKNSKSMAKIAKEIDNKLKHNNTLLIILWIISILLYTYKYSNISFPNKLSKN